MTDSRLSPKTALCGAFGALVLLSALIALLLVPPPAFSANGFLAMWGSKGAGNGQFSNPLSIDVGPSGNVYVADYGNDRIQKFTANGAFLGEWGPHGNNSGQFRAPASVAVSPTGDVYVAFNDFIEGPSGVPDNPIQRFSSDGDFLGHIGPNCFGASLDASQGSVYVNCGSLESFSFDGMKLNEWSGFPSGAIASDPAGNLYVAEIHRNRIEKYSPSGKFLKRWSPHGAYEGDVADLATDDDGHVFVAMSAGNRIEEFTSNGAFVGGWGTRGAGPGQFFYPAGIAVDAKGSVYVSDSYNHRIQKFNPEAAIAAAGSGVSGKALAPGAAPVIGNMALLNLRCPGSTACAGKLALVVQSRKGGRARRSDATTSRTRKRSRRGRRRVRRIVVGRARYRVPAGKHRRVRIPLTRQGRRLLRRRGLRVQLRGPKVRNRMLTLRLRRRARQGHR